MKCPFCGGKSRILDSRQRIKYYKRRHECIVCHKKFTTHEVYAEDYTKPKAYIKNKIT